MLINFNLEFLVLNYFSNSFTKNGSVATINDLICYYTYLKNNFSSSTNENNPSNKSLEAPINICMADFSFIALKYSQYFEVRKVIDENGNEAFGIQRKKDIPIELIEYINEISFPWKENITEIISTLTNNFHFMRNSYAINPLSNIYDLEINETEIIFMKVMDSARRNVLIEPSNYFLSSHILNIPSNSIKKSTYMSGKHLTNIDQFMGYEVESFDIFNPESQKLFLKVAEPMKKYTYRSNKPSPCPTTCEITFVSDNGDIYNLYLFFPYEFFEPYVEEARIRYYSKEDLERYMRLLSPNELRKYLSPFKIVEYDAKRPTKEAIIKSNIFKLGSAIEIEDLFNEELLNRLLEGKGRPLRVIRKYRSN